MPPGLATGVATFTILDGARSPQKAIGAVGQVAPALFSAGRNGSRMAAATAIRVYSGSPPVTRPITLFDCSSPPCKAVPIEIGTDAPVYLTLYGTGIRNRSSLDLDHAFVSINGINVPVLYAGPQPDFAGLDQINVPLTPDLRGSGVAEVVLKVNQHQANTVTVDLH
jgi:uncharacterized protein (TIGR03437 family)